jgi:hypothetical protein
MPFAIRPLKRFDSSLRASAWLVMLPVSMKTLGTSDRVGRRLGPHLYLQAAARWEDRGGFNDPDGNRWLQQITQRIPGRV